MATKHKTSFIESLIWEPVLKVENFLNDVFRLI